MATEHLQAWRTSDRCRELLRTIGRKHGAANGRANALPRDVAAARIRLRHYLRGAKDRNKEWALPFDEFVALIAKPCWYCGATPRQTIPRFRDQPHNGIDRIDNSRGYVSDNVVSCCGDCNSAKSDMSQVEFLALVRRIAERH
jgi:hypothetical protein